MPREDQIQLSVAREPRNERATSASDDQGGLPAIAASRGGRGRERGEACVFGSRPFDLFLMDAAGCFELL